MISDVSEILETKKLIEAEKERLRRRKINHGNPRLGAMIEVPSTVLIAEEIAQAHHGWITAETTLGSGSTFTCYLLQSS